MLDGTVPRWGSGDLLAIAWPGGLALVDVPMPLAERIWARVHQDSRLGTFLKTLAEGSDAGFLDLPTFAVAVADGERWHIAVRGALTVEAQLSERVELLSGEGITTWAERVLPEPQALRLGAIVGEAGPLVDGVVPAGGLVLGEFRAGSSAQQINGPDAEAAAPNVHQAPDPEVLQDAGVECSPSPGEGRNLNPEAEPSAEPEPEADLDVLAEPAQEPDLDAAALEGSFAAAQETLAEDEEPEADVAGQAGPQDHALADTPAGNKYAALWDHSIALDVEAAAIRPDEDQAESVAGQAAILAVEGRSQQPSAAEECAPDQLSGDTVIDDSEGGVQIVSLPAGREILARFCSDGHPNPPERLNCYVCGAQVAGEARLSPRPQLGWLRVEGGETVPLNGPIIAGRNPKSSVLALDDNPRLVALPHPHVSGNHLAILIEGWRLMARDLRSRNGTYLRRHGKPPVRLPDTPVPLVPGDLIDLGHGLFLHLDRTP